MVHFANMGHMMMIMGIMNMILALCPAIKWPDGGSTAQEIQVVVVKLG